MNAFAPKLALLFPGVGSQETGMAKSFYDRLPYVKDVFDEASDLLRLNLADICFSSDYTAQLNRIEISQVALFTACIAILRAFNQELGLAPTFCLGHSLGEYAALCAGGALRFADAVEIVYQRGRIIREMTASQRGTMMWVINLATEVVDEVCAEHHATGQPVFVSAYDSPTQCSISGAEAAIIRLAQALEQRGAIVYPLKLAGPYHSPLMQPAADALAEVLSRYTCTDPTVQVIANYNARPYEAAGNVAHHLSAQLVSPVRWRESIRYLAGTGARIAIEIGPKNVLQFLHKKNTTAIQVASLNEYAMLDEIRRAFVIGPDQALAVIERCLRTAVTARNYNNNRPEYHEQVVRPYREVEQLYDELSASGQAPDQSQIDRAIAMVQSVLATKHLPGEIQQRKLDELFGSQILKL